MTALEQLNEYLRRFEGRLRWLAASRGAAITGTAALLLTVVLVWIADRYRFAQNVVRPLRFLLFAAVAAAIAFTLARPLYKINRRRVTRIAEEQVPGFGERLLTVTERPDAANPFTELVAEDAMRVAQSHPPEQFAESRTLFTLAAAGVGAIAVLLWLIVAGPGFWGYGASLLWTGTASVNKRPMYEVTVQPGDRTVRRKSDQIVSAQLIGFSARNVTLHAKYGGAPKWETVAMQPRAAGNGYQFVLAGLSEAVEYYVAADGTQSKHYNLAVRDLPGVKRLRVSLHFPEGLGLKDNTADPGGDIRAVQGTQAEISVLTNRPLDHGLLMLENGSKIDLAKGEGNWVTAKLPVSKDGSYHIAALDGGETIRITDDYFIEAKKDEAPSVKISRPGKDPKVSPIEEVPITVEAADDFGLNSMDLHYSVNGAPEQVVPLLKAKGAKEAEGKTQLSLETFKLAPGDLVSYYATARDAKTTARSDIAFAQAEPFDFKFSQSQQAGGGGGGAGNQESDISARQKQIIAATWNEVRDGGKGAAALHEEARFLSETEAKLSEQAKTLAQRMANRELSGANSEFENFSKVMIQASSDMTGAVEQLKPGKFNNALAPEQKALQSLLRAESMFRNIQVAFGQQGGGGGGGGGAQRDLARMFDLELDTTKNQYETGQSQEQAKADQQKAIDDAFERLQALARRQQELAAQNPQQQQPFEQRWQEEQLRRDAEELKRQLEQLSQSGGQQGQQQGQQGQQGQRGQQQGSQSGSQQSGSQQSNSQQSSQQSGSQQSGSQQSGSQQSGSQQSGQSGGQSGSQRSSQQSAAMSRAMRESVKALQRAEDEMRKAVSSHDATAQQRASDELAEAQRLLNDALHEQAGNSVADLAQRAQALADEQRDVANRMKEMYGPSQLRARRPGMPNPAEGGGDSMSPMNDPNQRYGYYRRRGIQPEQEALRPTTPQEKALAAQKEQLAKDLERLQHQMQEQGQSLAASQPGASSKMRKALSNAEQKELALRIQKNAEWIRQGYGDRNLDMEREVTAGMDQLSRDLRDAQQAVKPDQGDKQSEMLSQLRQLRETLQRAQGQHPGQGQGQGQSQEQGQGQAPGQGQGQSQQARGQGQSPGQNPGPGQYSPNGGPASYGGGIDRRGIQDAMGQLNALRGQIGPHDYALRGYVDNTLGSLRTLNADPRLLQSAIGQDAVSHLQRLEVELGRRLGEPQAVGARSGAAEPSPEKYRDAVAEYFKKLSQPQ